MRSNTSFIKSSVVYWSSPRPPSWPLSKGPCAIERLLEVGRPAPPQRDDFAAGDPARRGVYLTAASGRKQRFSTSTNRTVRTSIQSSLLLGLATVLTACGSSGLSDDDAISRYCQYGSVSQSQFIGCVKNVDIDQVAASQTEAGRFAFDEGAECGAGAGPLCEGIDLYEPPTP